MDKLITREEYLANPSKLHDAYFLQFATFYTHKAIRERFTIALLLRMYAENGNFNNPGPVGGVQRPELKSWETLSLPGRFDLRRMDEAGEICTVSTMVCTLKAVARAEVLREVEKSAQGVATSNSHLIEPGEEVSATEFAKRIRANPDRPEYANLRADIIQVAGGYWVHDGLHVRNNGGSVIVSEL